MPFDEQYAPINNDDPIMKKDEGSTRTGGGGGGTDIGRRAATNNDGGARGGIASAGGSSSSSSAGSPRQRPASATAGGGGAPKPPPALPAPPPTAATEGPPATAPGGKGSSAHSSSGSGSDNAGSGGTASSSGRSSGNAAVVTASAANNTTATSGSGSDDRSGSGRGDSGSGSGSNNRRSAGEASGEYYYAGYGSVASNQATVGSAPAQEVAGMPAVESFQGAPLAAAAAAAANGPQGMAQGMPPRAGHVAVAADGGGLPPAGAFASHLRHHSRHPGHARQGLNQRPPPLPQAPAQAPVQAPLPPAQPDAGIPRLPPSDERAVLQRVPRTHATVVAGDVPPPPTSSDSRSSGSGVSSGDGGRRRRRPTANAAAANAQPMVASVRLANGGPVDSVNASGSSPASSDSSQAGIPSGPNYRHVTTMDPMLRKKIRLTKEAKPPPQAQTSLKRKLSAMNQGDSDGDAASSENGAATARDQVGTSVRSMVHTSAGGSDGGYAASSERQSGSSGSGSDSLSSDDANKGTKDAALAPHVPASDHVDHFRVGRWRTETSSMSSSVLADFSSSSVVHEGGPARNDSPCSSLSEEGAAAPARKRAREATGGTAPTNALQSGLSIMERSLQRKVRSGEHHHHRRHRKTLEESFLSAKRDLAEEARPMDAEAVVASKTAGMEPICADATIYALGQDVMAQVVSYLDPVEAHSFLTQPLSKAWLVTYAAPQELWKVLCASKPFCAKLDEGPGSSDASACGFPHDPELRHLFGRYRLLHASFVRCMKYLSRLQDDAMNGRTPSVHATAESPNDVHPFGKNAGLKAYFAKARRLARSNRSESSSGTSESDSRGSGKKRKAITAAGTSETAPPNSRRLGRSMLTDRLLRPTAGGDVDNVNLPWSCAIYSVVNWMVAFADVEGIQIMCLKCLPYLLEDESQRTTAQRAGLTDSVLRAMVLFPDSIELHTVAFHTLVLLARPLGGNEGMLFHTAMVNTRGIFNNGSSSGKNGIVIMLDSMRRFAQDEILQAMSCWSLVNVALTPLQKSMLVKLGGLTVTSNAMLQHPYNAEVQFRALFALINLVIPTEARPDETEEMRQFEREIFQQLGEAGDTSEKEMIDASVSNISNLVVVAMKNFCSSEAILNRACLVLHNLSLNEEYHSTLLWTPNCYQMLEWCLGNYPHDHVLQQSAGGTIQRLNATLSSDEELRSRFTQSIRAQQQHSLELARQEAVMLQEQESEQQQMQMDAAA
ncbi:hypothetical protein ACHAXT_008082 [Thalassiosira profunda]